MNRHEAFLVIVILTTLSLLCIVCSLYTNYARSTMFFETKAVVVSQGDTLWRIAQREQPDGNTQELVYYIREINDIEDPGSLQPGQEILVPVFDSIKCARDD